MALLENGLLKSSATMALWGLGVYVGLTVAVPLLTGVAKPLVKEAGRGYQSLRSRLKRSDQGETGEEHAEAEIEIAGQEAAAAAAPAAASAAAMEAVSAPAPSKPAQPATRPRRPRKAAAPTGKPSAKWPKAALYERAKELKIAGRSAMSKEQLLAALQAAVSAPETA